MYVIFQQRRIEYYPLWLNHKLHICHRLRDDSRVHSCFLFSNDSVFCIIGAVCQHNLKVKDEENPRFVLEVPHILRCGITQYTKTKTIRSCLFSKTTVSHERY